MPKPAPANWRVAAKDLGDSFELTVHTAAAGSQAWFAPLDPLVIESAAPQKAVSSKTEIRQILRKSDQLLKPLSRLRGVLVMPQGAYMIDVPVAPAPAKQHK